MYTCLKLVNDAMAYPCMFLQLTSLNISLLLFSKAMCTCLKLVNDAIAYPCMFLQLISLNNSLLLFSKAKNSAPVKK